MSRLIGFLSVAAGLVAAWPSLAPAVSLAPGDLIVLSDEGGWPWKVYKVDPVSFDTARITTGGLLTNAPYPPGRITVGSTGTIYVASQAEGVVAVDPGSGAQSVVVSVAELGGRVPEGICRGPGSTLFVTAASAGVGAVLEVVPATHAVALISSGGLLVRPRCVAVSPDGALYVGEFANPPNLDWSSPYGNIVRVESGSGAQRLLTTDGSLMLGPFDIAVTPDGYVWSAQRGLLSRRGAGWVRTRLSDGSSEAIWDEFLLPLGIAIGLHGEIYLADCLAHGFDCGLPFLHEYPGGPRHGPRPHALAVVPDGATPTRSTSWGRLKTMYR